MIMMGLLGTGMILFNLKVSRTMSRLLIHENGRMSYVEVYRLLGFSRRVVSIENINYKGLNYFLHPSLRIPRIKYHQFSILVSSRVIQARYKEYSSKRNIALIPRR
jgi:hypothetical protein